MRSKQARHVSELTLTKVHAKTAKQYLEGVGIDRKILFGNRVLSAS
jgi:hypothetical protein